jgi:endonuclease/exonuclease/phosphatase family metal-dependent hydrolase
MTTRLLVDAMVRILSAVACIALFGVASSFLNGCVDSAAPDRDESGGEGEGANTGEGEGDEGEGDGGEGEGDGGEGEGEDRPFSVLNINLLHGFPTGEQLEERTQIVIDAILALTPDAVAVQEASESGTHDNIAGLIADAVGYEWHWQRASGFNDVFNEGPAVLSRWPILDTAFEQLEGTGDQWVGRVCVRATLDTPHGSVQVASIHASGGDANPDQALLAYRFITDTRGDLPGFLAGDMNAVPDELGMRFLRGETEIDGTTGDLRDAWLSVNAEDLGFTSSADDPDRRIDYIYLQPGAAAAGIVQTCEIMFDEPVDGLLASDHLGVYCTFDLR